MRWLQQSCSPTLADALPLISFRSGLRWSLLLRRPGFLHALFQVFGAGFSRAALAVRRALLVYGICEHHFAALEVAQLDAGLFIGMPVQHDNFLGCAGFLALCRARKFKI